MAAAPTTSQGQRISAMVPWQMHSRLTMYLEETGFTLSEVLRRALDAYLNPTEKGDGNHGN